MCGIAGLVGEHPGASAALPQMLRALAHRGPDGRGWLASTRGSPTRCGDDLDVRAGGAEAVLGHLRLSVVDLSTGGAQPMSTEDGRWHLTFNGEIYNYVELRAELEGLGYRFRSHSDTEVLLKAWEAWGSSCLPRLVGMYAFAILDTVERVVTLVRDPFGIKPMFYARTPHGTVFASELPAILASGVVSRRVNPSVLYDYLSWGVVDAGDESMVASVYRLPMGHLARIRLDAPSFVEPVEFWSLPPDRLEMSAADAADRLRSTFLDSVRLHLRSDVPLGCALSGGVDSSAILGSMRHLLGPDVPLSAFSYVPDDPRYDESRWIEMVGTSANATVHRVTATPRGLLADIDPLILSQGEPFSSTSMYAQRRVFERAAEEGVTILLDGQGADELFGGYRGHLAGKLVGLLRQGRFVRAARLVVGVAQRPDISINGRLAARALAPLLPGVLTTRRSALGSDASRTCLDRRWFEDRGVRLGPRSLGPSDIEESLSSAFTDTMLPSFLRYEDRSSMTWSRESRVPFLTPPMVDLVFRLPTDLLVAEDGTTKAIFRTAMRGLVPDPILDRRDKVGFQTPDRWLDALVPRIKLELADDRRAQRVGLDAARCLERLRATPRVRSHGPDWTPWRWLNVLRWAELLEIAE